MGDDDKSLVYNINLCRICQVPSNLDLVKTSTTFQGETFLDALKFIFNDIIWVEDHLLSVACTICLKKVAEIADFKRLCWNTNIERQTINLTFPPKEEVGSCKVEETPEVDDAPENYDWPITEEKEQSTKKMKRKRARIKVNVKKEKPKQKSKKKRSKSNDEPSSKTKCFPCEICGENFDRIDYFERHLFRHNGTRNHICPACGLKYITHSDLTAHLKLHSEECNYACDVCPKKFKTSSCLKAHKNVVHTDPKDYKHVCTECGRKFSSAGVLRVHTKRHNQVRNFPCELCEKSFISKDELVRHLLVHTSVKAFHCDQCPNEYTRNMYLKIHHRKAHGDLKRDKVKKLYNCIYCGKSMDFKEKFKHHVRVHGDIKPYQCRRCDAKFVCKVYTKLHLRKVHDIRCNMRRGFEEYVLVDLPQKEKDDTTI